MRFEQRQMNCRAGRVERRAKLPDPVDEIRRAEFAHAYEAPADDNHVEKVPPDSRRREQWRDAQASIDVGYGDGADLPEHRRKEILLRYRNNLRSSSRSRRRHQQREIIGPRCVRGHRCRAPGDVHDERGCRVARHPNLHDLQPERLRDAPDRRMLAFPTTTASARRIGSTSRQASSSVAGLSGAQVAGSDGKKPPFQGRSAARRRGLPRPRPEPQSPRRAIDDRGEADQLSAGVRAGIAGARLATRTDRGRRRCLPQRFQISALIAPAFEARAAAQVRWTQPFTVKRLSAKSFEGTCTGTTSCMIAALKNTMLLLRGSTS